MRDFYSIYDLARLHNPSETSELGELFRDYFNFEVPQQYSTLTTSKFINQDSEFDKICHSYIKKKLMTSIKK